MEIGQATSYQVDLLAVVDNGGSMREEQASLPPNLSALAEAVTLRAPGSPPTWRGDAGVHVGVVSTDMGTQDLPVTTCDDAHDGDDGELQNQPSPALDGCDATYPPFLTEDASSSSAGIADDFACIATLGTEGCGFQMPFLAAETALTVQAGPGGANEGFLRDGAMLAIVVVSSENDCSVSDPAIFGDDDTLGALNLRCFFHEDMLRSIEDLSASLLDLKTGRPEEIVVAGAVGVPPELVSLSGDELRTHDAQTASDFQELLDDARMAEMLDFSQEGGGSRLVPVCSVPGLAQAFPGRREVELIRVIDDQGGNGIVQSICQADWGANIGQLVARAAQRRMGCLPSLIGDSDGRPLETGDHTDCALHETLPDDRPCGAGAVRTGGSRSQTECRLCEAGDTDGECAGALVAWSYVKDDPACGGGARIDLADGFEAPAGTVLRLECPATVMEKPPWC